MTLDERPESGRGPEFLSDADLKEVRDHVDWQQLFLALGLRKDERKSKPEDWWALSPLSSEDHASFHMNPHGWYCFSTNQGGGPIELVQAVHRSRGQQISCYDAGRWLLEHGLSHLSRIGSPPPPKTPSLRPVIMDILAMARGEDPENWPPGNPAAGARSEGEEEVSGRKLERQVPILRPLFDTDDPADENPSIRQDLVPLLTLQGEHPEFVRRGISRETCEYLSCGYLTETSRSPLRGRIVFQIRGYRRRRDGTLKNIIVGHIGRATTPEQEEQDGKWHVYAGFNKSRELFNLDCTIEDEDARDQAMATGHILLVEGPFDVAKLIEADVKNVVASLGSQLSLQQAKLLSWRARRSSPKRILVFYDRDAAGQQGAAKAVELLKELGLEAEVFDWSRTFASSKRPVISIPDTVKDPGDLSVEQVRWLRINNVI